MTARIFPDGFLWGVATSAYQIEGATRERGRGERLGSLRLDAGKHPRRLERRRGLRPLPPVEGGSGPGDGAGGALLPLESENAPRTGLEDPAEDRTDTGWEILPQGLHDLLRRIHREYGPGRTQVTECGAAFDDAPGPHGRIRDTRRIDCLRGHLLAAPRAIAEGVPLAGFFLWTLLDNFEWEHARFGVVWVDRRTMERIPKDSALWYRDVIAANAVEDGAPRVSRSLA